MNFLTGFYFKLAQILSSSIGLFLFVLGPMKSPNPDHAVNGFSKKTHCYTPCCGKMPIPYRHINK